MGNGGACQRQSALNCGHEKETQDRREQRADRHRFDRDRDEAVALLREPRRPLAPAQGAGRGGGNAAEQSPPLPREPHPHGLCRARRPHRPVSPRPQEHRARRRGARRDGRSRALGRGHDRAARRARSHHGALCLGFAAAGDRACRGSRPPPDRGLSRGQVAPAAGLGRRPLPLVGAAAYRDPGHRRKGSWSPPASGQASRGFTSSDIASGRRPGDRPAPWRASCRCSGRADP
jgi:hypothetical protein